LKWGISVRYIIIGLIIEFIVICGILMKNKKAKQLRCANEQGKD
jgi:hypothetical protein